MVKNIQSLCKSLGDYGCYFFCLIDIAEGVTGREYDVFDVLIKCINKGYVFFDFDDYNNVNNMYIENPVAILNMITGLEWSVKKEESDYQIKDDDYIVEFWSRKGYKGGHFARTLKGYNSLVKSYNVDEGKILSYRVFRII